MIDDIVSSAGDLTPALIVGIGVMVGMIHAFEPDHVAAVGTQLVKRKSKGGTKNRIMATFAKSSILGLLWGAGHTTALAAIGLAVYFLALSISNEIFSGLEILVGVMLVLLGVAALQKERIKIRHRHPHLHSDGNVHFDAHGHDDHEHRHGHKSYVIGMVHGLAGSGGLVTLTALTFGSAEMAMAFILLFGLGSAVGMIVVGGILGLPLMMTGRESALYRIFRYGTISSSLLLGAYILFGIADANLMQWDFW